MEGCRVWGGSGTAVGLNSWRICKSCQCLLFTAPWCLWSDMWTSYYCLNSRNQAPVISSHFVIHTDWSQEGHEVWRWVPSCSLCLQPSCSICIFPSVLSWEAQYSDLDKLPRCCSWHWLLSTFGHLFVLFQKSILVLLLYCVSSREPGLDV